MKDDDFIKKYRKIDFSNESLNKDKILEKLNNEYEKLNENSNSVRKKTKIKISFIAVASLITILSITVYADEILKIIKTFTIGNYAEYTVVEENEKSFPISKELIGLIFDKDGNELFYYPKDRKYFNKNGDEVITLFDTETKKEYLETRKEYEKWQKENSDKFSSVVPTTDIANLETARNYFITNILYPSYLPKGYVFEKVVFYTKSEEDIKTQKNADKYMTLYFTNGEYYVTYGVKFMDKDTSFKLITGMDFKEIVINSVKGLVSEKNLDIQIDDILYSFYGNETINSDELIKMAESLK